MFWRKKKKQPEKVIELELPVESLPSISVNMNDSVLKLGNSQHQGRREYQEDSFGFSDISNNPKAFLAVLADGMGGLSNGKAVSSAVVKSLLDEFNSRESRFKSSIDLLEYIQEINTKICAEFCPSGTVEAGSTVVATMIRENELFWVCVGDSRVYLKRSGKLYQINEDHDFLNQLLKAVISEKISLEEAFDNIKKDSLTSCMGNINSERFDYNLKGLQLLPGDELLLCSDGVYNGLYPEEMNRLLTGDPIADAEHIKESVLAKSFKNQDNLTTIIIKKEV